MKCVADRFVETSNGEVVDLATGERVALAMASAGGETDQRQWMIRCDLFQKLHHPAMATLVDYGLAGESQRFEAWRCSEAWHGNDSAAADVLRTATAFLEACGLVTGSERAGTLHRFRSRPVVIPDSSVACSIANVSEKAAVLPVEHCGVLRVERSASSAVAELFDDYGCQPQIVSISGAARAGKTTMVRQLARAARLQGYVPFSVGLLDTPFVEALDGRSAVILDDGLLAGGRSLLDVATRSCRRHILITTSHDEAGGGVTVTLNRIAPAALLAAVLPAAMANDPAIRQAATRANGVPGAFIDLLQSQPLVRRGPRPRASKAAEQTPAYGVDESSGLLARSAVLPVMKTTWPAPGELAGLRRQMDVALAQLRAGRHAPGDRGLREAIGGLARRGVWTSAADGSLALARSLLRRGRARHAVDVLDRAREYCKCSADAGAMLSMGTLSGAALVDLGRLDEAISVLGAAASAVMPTDDMNLVAGIEIARARCRFWRGEYVEACDVLNRINGSDLRENVLVRLHAMRARVAVGAGDLAGAVAAAVEAQRRATILDDPETVAEASYAAAFAHLALGDVPAVQSDATACVTAARISRDSLRAFQVQLVLGEQLRRLGRRREALEAVRRVNRASPGSLPVILRRRRAILADLLNGLPMVDVVARHITGSGVPALGLFLPPDVSTPGTRLPAFWDQAMETLRLCQDAGDERTTLIAVCGHVQRQLHAAGVAFFGVERNALVRLAANGGGIEPTIAERTVAAAIPIAPHRLDERVEASAPVRYGGAIIGVIAARWTLGAVPDHGRTIAAMTVATAAAGPIVAALLAARQRTDTATANAIVGVSLGVTDVRRSIERAASAPFAVLIEGESGSGKELVAREVHRAGVRRDRPFCTLNCAALPDELVESELFGHARGAFTGAVGERVGVFEEASTGTLLLDEVGELSPRAQAKVLRVIQEGELRRIGENVSRRIDVRIISATNRDLRREVAQGRFRLDLLYRLDVIRIIVPPLRERREDIPILVDRLWREATERVGCRATLAAATIAALVEHEWPGNVRELQNVLASLAVRVAKRGVVPPEALPPPFAGSQRQAGCRLDDARRVFEERFVRAALVRNGGRRSMAAAELGLTRQGLMKLMTRLGLQDGTI